LEKDWYSCSVVATVAVRNSLFQAIRATPVFIFVAARKVDSLLARRAARRAAPRAGREPPAPRRTCFGRAGGPPPRLARLGPPLAGRVGRRGRAPPPRGRDPGPVARRAHGRRRLTRIPHALWPAPFLFHTHPRRAGHARMGAAEPQPHRLGRPPALWAGRAARAATALWGTRRWGYGDRPPSPRAPRCGSLLDQPTR